jgi:hypothetical protein
VCSPKVRRAAWYEGYERGIEASLQASLRRGSALTHLGRLAEAEEQLAAAWLEARRAFLSGIALGVRFIVRLLPLSASFRTMNRWMTHLVLGDDPLFVRLVTDWVTR